MLPMFQRQTALGSTHLVLLGSASHAHGSEKPLRISNIPKWLEKWQFLVSSSLKKASKSQTARARACAEQDAYRPAWQLVRAVACAILYALGVTCARAMSPRVKQNGSHLSKKMNEHLIDNVVYIVIRRLWMVNWYDWSCFGCQTRFARGFEHHPKGADGFNIIIHNA